jgi:hypothetical protein
LLLSFQHLMCSAVLAGVSLLAGCGLSAVGTTGPSGVLPNPVKTIAGAAGIRGNADETGKAASFSNLQGIVVVGTDTYIADTDNNAIRKLDTVTGAVTTFATGFNCPHGITSDGTNLYVADTYNCAIQQIVISTGVVSLLTGVVGSQGSANGGPGVAKFNYPYGIATDGTNLYVADTYNETIRTVVIATGVASTLTGTLGSIGSSPGGLGVAKFFFPFGIATDGTNLYVSDYGNSTIRQVVIATGVASTLAGTAGTTGTTDATGAAAAFNQPTGVATDGTNLFIADTYNHTIRQMVLGSGVVTTVAGQPGAAGSVDGGKFSSTGVYPIPPARLSCPVGIAVASGITYVADSGNNVIREIQ